MRAPVEGPDERLVPTGEDAESNATVVEETCPAEFVVA